MIKICQMKLWFTLTCRQQSESAFMCLSVKFMHMHSVLGRAGSGLITWTKFCGIRSLLVRVHISKNASVSQSVQTP